MVIMAGPERGRHCDPAMSENPPAVGPLARQLIEQCRREIAAAWEQVEAGRRILDHSRWLLARWAEQARQPRTVPQSFEPRLAGTFEPVESPRERLKPHRLARMRLSRYAALAAQRLQAQARAH